MRQQHSSLRCLAGVCQPAAGDRKDTRSPDVPPIEIAVTIGDGRFVGSSAQPCPDFVRRFGSVLKVFSHRGDGAKVLPSLRSSILETSVYPCRFHSAI